MGNNLVDRTLHPPTLGRDKYGIVPGLSNLGKSILDRAHIRHEFQFCIRQVSQQIAPDAKEERVSRGEHDSSPFGRGQTLHNRGKVGFYHQGFTFEVGEQRQLTGTTDQDVRLFDNFQGPATESLLAFNPGADDMDCFHLPASSWRWLLKKDHCRSQECHPANSLKSTLYSFPVAPSTLLCAINTPIPSGILVCSTVQKPDNGMSIIQIVDDVQTAIVLLDGKRLLQRGTDCIEQNNAVHAAVRHHGDIAIRVLSPEYA